MRVDISGETCVIDFYFGKRIVIDIEQARHLAFLLNAAIQDEEVNDGLTFEEAEEKYGL